MLKNLRIINVTQDVYDRLVKSFTPKGLDNEPLNLPDISRLHLENDPPFDINIIPGEGFLTIDGSVTRKELQQLSNLLNSSVVESYNDTTEYGDKDE